MNTLRKTLIALFAAAVCSVITVGTASAQQEILVGGYDPKQWEVGHEARSQSQIVTEFVRSGETIKNWTELLTLQVLRKPRSPEPIDVLVPRMHQEIFSRCPAIKWSVVSRNVSSDTEEAGMLYEWAIKGCPPDSDQHEIARVIYGKVNIFRIAYTVKTSALPPEKREIWIKELTSAKVGQLVESGSVGPSNDDVEAVRRYRLAANQGDAQGQVNLGAAYGSGRGLPKDDAEAVRLYRLAADQGNALAQVYLGAMYERGRGGLTRNVVESARLYRLAAVQGDAQAQYNLGSMYANGEGGLPKDNVEAVRLIRLSAGQGNARAQSALGFMYVSGTGGLSKDDVQAVRLFQLAADQGVPMAQNNLGFMYEKGRGGLPADLETAISWYRLSAGQGEPLAIANLKRLGRQ